jgi:hypothetical protein
MKLALKIVFLIALLFTGEGALSEAQANSSCYDLSKRQPSQLEGVLVAVIFAGPPNYEDVQKGDSPEPGYILQLPNNVCTEGDDFADPNNSFNEVQLFADSEAVSRELQKYQNTRVVVNLNDAFAAHTGHHHRPLVARVSSVNPAVSDITDEYGSAATTVRAFYYALSQGNGEAASSFIISEKRSKGPFSAKSITNFYSSLDKPLELISLDPLGTDTFDVRYTFRSKAGTCDGHATVKTTLRNDRFYIQSIKSLNGC